MSHLTAARLAADGSMSAAVIRRCMASSLGDASRAASKLPKGSAADFGRRIHSGSFPWATTSSHVRCGL